MSVFTILCGLGIIVAPIGSILWLGWHKADARISRAAESRSRMQYTKWGYPPKTLPRPISPGPYRSAPELPNPEPRDIYAKLEAIAKAQDEARDVLGQYSRALTALARELASLKDGAADAATHCDDEHGGKVA